MINAGYSVESPWPICYSGQSRGDLIFRHLSDLLGPLCQGGRGGSPGALHQPSSRNTAEVAIKLLLMCLLHYIRGIFLFHSLITISFGAPIEDF